MELVYIAGSKSAAFGHEGSSPSIGTIGVVVELADTMV